jgi:hypothetical protein
MITMLDATIEAIEALKAYSNAEESSLDVEDQLCRGLVNLLLAAAQHDIVIAELFDAYKAWLEED